MTAKRVAEKRCCMNECGGGLLRWIGLTVYMLLDGNGLWVEDCRSCKELGGKEIVIGSLNWVDWVIELG